MSRRSDDQLLAQPRVVRYRRWDALPWYWLHVATYYLALWVARRYAAAAIRDHLDVRLDTRLVWPVTERIEVGR